MADDPYSAELIPVVQQASAGTTKTALVAALLHRARGATLSELETASAWQPHTVRAHLTRIRNTGKTLERVERRSGPAAYRFVREAAATGPISAQPALDEGSSK